MITNDELRVLYGPEAVMSVSEPYALIHLDKPDVQTIAKRTAEFNPDTYFACDCRICAVTKESGIVVFDENAYSDLDDQIEDFTGFSFRREVAR